MPFRDRFKALFSPSRRWLDADPRLSTGGGAWGPRHCVLPRSESLHRRLVFTGVPASQRAEALVLAVQRHSPLGGTAHAARWLGDVAHVWMPTTALDGRIGPDEVLVAESALLAPPGGVEVERLVALRQGVEGQVWRHGDLVATRWWPSPPGALEWGRFLRAAGRSLAEAVDVPPVEAADALPDPWGQPTGRMPWAPAQLEAAFWSLVLAVFALVAGWQFAATATWSIATTWQAHRLADLRASAAPLIAARERAEAARARIDAYGALTETPVDYLLLADLRTLLPPEARLVAWSRDGRQLRAEVTGAGDDPRRFVQALAPHPLLSSVIANPAQEGRMQLDIDLSDGRDGSAP